MDFTKKNRSNNWIYRDIFKNKKTNNRKNGMKARPKHPFPLPLNPSDLRTNTDHKLTFKNKRPSSPPARLLMLCSEIASAKSQVTR